MDGRQICGFSRGDELLRGGSPGVTAQTTCVKGPRHLQRPREPRRPPSEPVCSGFLPSLRVNLDMGKIVYSWVIRRDSKIPGTVVRSSTIPEQLGRISYLLTDKTGELLPGPSRASGGGAAPGFFLETVEPAVTHFGEQIIWRGRR